jgi:hypothetical protein
MKHILAFKGANLKVGELERNSLYEYEGRREKTKPGTASVTIRNEQSTINHMMDFAYQRVTRTFPNSTSDPSIFAGKRLDEGIFSNFTNTTNSFVF